MLHVIPSLSPKHGGPSIAMPLMARSLTEAGVEVDVATTDDDGPGCRMNVLLGRRIERDGYGLFHFHKQTEFYKVSLPLSRWLKQHIPDYDVVHVHALFQFASFAAARFARQRHVPYIIRPLGVLNRWGIENRRRGLKAWSLRIIEKPMMRHAAAMHYTSEQERIEAEAAGATARPTVIPLGIDLTPFQSLPGPERFHARFPEAKDREIILFLSRLNPKKGLDLLIEAFAKMRNSKGGLLVIVGDGEASYEQSLREQAKRLGVAEDILWAGFLAGEEKLSVLSAASIFVLPSRSENFGIALVEALAAGIPCISTDGVAISEDIRKHDAGLVVNTEVPALGEAIKRLLSDDALRERLGANAKELANEQFSLQAMGENLKELYKKILETRALNEA
ncbi:MAG TPA: glycosyltransferase [Verrucomicrobiae bacterium]|nr:glycosyltransferase [Verrucomicrobiae bacterium]